MVIEFDVCEATAGLGHEDTVTENVCEYAAPARQVVTNKAAAMRSEVLSNFMVNLLILNPAMRTQFSCQHLDLCDLITVPNYTSPTIAIPRPSDRPERPYACLKPVSGERSGPHQARSISGSK
jgi:hypothetical protein